MRKLAKILLKFIYDVILLLMWLIVLQLHFLVPISIEFIIFNILLVLAEYLPIFLPKKYWSLKFFQVKNYDNITNAFLGLFALDILMQHSIMVEAIIRHNLNLMP